MDINNLINQLTEYCSVSVPPEGESLQEELSDIMEIMTNLPLSVRPTMENGRPGGLVSLSLNIPTLIIPDLHGRRDFFYKALTTPLYRGKNFLELMSEDRGNVVCVGDAFHGEAPVKDRWEKAYKEFSENYRKTKAIDQEMTDNLRLLQMIIEVQSYYPLNFFFLKGNHENIDNETGAGNYGFRKFVYEGEMVRLWVSRFLGDSCFTALYNYEKLLPLAARGDGFLVTHAEPDQVYTEEQIISAYENDEVIYGLTWTNNGDAEPGSVSGTLENLFPGRPESICFGGHRPAAGGYALRSENRFIQINSPISYPVAIVRQGEGFNPEDQIINLPMDNLEV